MFVRPRPRRWALAALVLSGAWVGCASESLDGEQEGAGPRRLGRASTTIIGGAAEPGQPSVVAIVDPTRGKDVLVCSGVLVTPRIVVTAAHCLHPHVIGTAADKLAVVFGTDLLHDPIRVDVEHGAYHSDYRPGEPDAAHDIGALLLMTPAPVAPLPMGMGPSEGDEVLIVGFGTLAADGFGAEFSGAKRSGTALVGEVGESWFRIDRAPATTCAGDSGGATLARRGGVDILVGIHSRGDCASAVWDERLDAHFDGFLRTFKGSFGGCDQDGACALGCPGPDPDCPCAADDICNETCGRNDPDCDVAEEEGCEIDHEDGIYGHPETRCECAGDDCERTNPFETAQGVGGCATSPPAAGPGGWTGAALGLALFSLLACRRRSRRGGSSRFGSSPPP